MEVYSYLSILVNISILEDGLPGEVKLNLSLKKDRFRMV
jgi:hypothetical protein